MQDITLIIYVCSDEVGKQEALREARYSKCFLMCVPIFTNLDLLAIPDQIDIGRGILVDLLESDRYRMDVNRDGQVAQELGVKGVPLCVC